MQFGGEHILSAFNVYEGKYRQNSFLTSGGLQIAGLIYLGVKRSARWLESNVQNLRWAFFLKSRRTLDFNPSGVFWVVELVPHRPTICTPPDLRNEFWQYWGFTSVFNSNALKVNVKYGALNGTATTNRTQSCWPWVQNMDELKDLRLVSHWKKDKFWPYCRTLSEICSGSSGQIPCQLANATKSHSIDHFLQWLLQT